MMRGSVQDTQPRFGQASPSADVAKADPNFPSGGLAITPSYARYRDAAARLPTHAAAQDSVEDIVQYGIAGRVWEAAYLLQRYLTPPTSTTALDFDPPCSLFASEGDPITALELGAGVGLVGIHLALTLAARQQRKSDKGDRVVLTDLDNVVPLLQRNIGRAGLRTEESTNTLVSVLALPWGSTAHVDSVLHSLRTTRAGSRRLSHILCSDLVYFPELLPLLLRSLIHLTQPEDASSAAPAEVLISYKIRSLPKEEPFWRAFGAWFDYAPVLCRERKHDRQSVKSDVQQATTDSREWRRFGALHDDAFDASTDASTMAEDEVFIFVGRRRSETYASLAPASDDRLMQGWLAQAGEGGQEMQGKGVDTFELILMAAVEA